jgi:uncharacterized protein (TIGR00369 family)
MNDEALEQLREYVQTSVKFINRLGVRVEDLAPGRALFYLDAEEWHLNGQGLLHGGVHATLLDSCMAVAVSTLGGRTATIQMNVHFVAAAGPGRITCEAHVLHRTGRTATAEAKVHDSSGKLIAIGTGTFRIFDRLPRAPAETISSSTEGKESR